MSTSEELKVLASQEENDLKAMGLLNKALRESRSEKFSDKYLIQLKEKGYDDNFIKTRMKIFAGLKYKDEAFKILK